MKIGVEINEIKNRKSIKKSIKRKPGSIKQSMKKSIKLKPGSIKQ